MAACTELSRIEDELRKALDGPAWHGPALMESLKDVPVDVAPAKSLEHAHSIWEIALHVAAWHEAVARRITTGARLELSKEQDWPAVNDVSEAAWKATLKQVRQSHEGLLKAVAKLDDAQLSNPVAGRDYDIRFMLHGVAQHDAYHAGQIGLLKKSSR